MSSAPPPTEYFPGINFNPSFYNLGSSAVSLEYLQSNYLRSTGYAISRAQFTIFNGTVDINDNLDVSGNINASEYLLNGVPVNFSQWTTSVNDIYYTTGNVGIGKTNPSATYKLDVSGNINADKFFRAGTELTQYTDTNVRTVLSTSAGTNMTWNTGTNKFDVAAPYTDTNTRTVLSTSAGTNMTWNTGTNKFDVAAPYTDTNTRTVLSTSAGTNMTWNTGTNKFDVAAPYTLPTATNAILGGVKSGNDISVNPTTGIMSLSGNDIYLNGTTNKEYSWAGSNSSLGRAATAQAYSSSSLINDVVLRSANNLILQSGTTTSALIINTTNQAIFRNAVGVGLTTIPAGTIFDAGGIFKIATGSGTERLTITSTGVQVNNTLNISSGLNSGGLIRFGGFADDSSFDLAIIQNREYATNKGELLLFRGDNIEGTTGVDRIRLRSGAIAFDTYPATSTSSTAENIRMYIDGNGNVGINKTNPSQRLDVDGNIICNGYIQGSGPDGAFRIQRPDAWVRLRNSTETGHLDFAAGQLYSHSTITSVGATNVNGNLSVGGTSYLRNAYIYSGNEGSSIALYFGTPFTGSPTGASKSAIIAQAISSWSRHNLCFCVNTAADNSTNASTNDSALTITWDGWINLNRVTRFCANTWNTCTTGNARIYYAANDATYYRGHGPTPHVYRNGPDSTIAYFTIIGQLWLSSTVIQNSDSRIKKNIKDIDDEEALKKILAIEPKTYQYIDKKTKGDITVYGFIAQQVKEVIPHAIKIISQTIPNIYKNCNCKGDIIFVNIPQDVEINTQITLIDISDTHLRYKILEISEDYIKIDKVLDVENIFVYGYEIDDMHTMTKEYIYTLNVCATQILSRKIDEQKLKIDEQQNKINDLETRLKFLERMFCQ
jgi:hypothetical protein